MEAINRAVIDRVEKRLHDGSLDDQLRDDLAELVACARMIDVDPLTRVTNRAGLIADWPTLSRCAPAIVMIDLNKFKAINDHYGHAAGDQVLKAVALRMLECGGRVVRLGGDEFVIILAHSRERAIAMMRHLAEVIARPIRLANGKTVAVTAAIGVYWTSMDLSMALACADAAMYRAKTTGVPVAAYDPGRDRRPSARRPSIRYRDQRSHVSSPAGLKGPASDGH